jgi:hypothetical protein
MSYLKEEKSAANKELLYQQPVGGHPCSMVFLDDMIDENVPKALKGGGMTLVKNAVVLAEGKWGKERKTRQELSNDRRYWYQQQKKEKDATKAKRANAVKKRGNDSAPSGSVEASGRGGKKAKANSPDAGNFHDAGSPVSGSRERGTAELGLCDIWRLGKKAQELREALH